MPNPENILPPSLASKNTKLGEIIDNVKTDGLNEAEAHIKTIISSLQLSPETLKSIKHGAELESGHGVNQSAKPPAKAPEGRH